jgi:glycosyltransferase involved in cell wall biosynthesis
MRKAAPRLLLTTDVVGGVWHYAVDLAASLGPLGCEVLLALLGPAPDDHKRARIAALPHVKLIETGLELDWLAHDAAIVEAAGCRIAELAGDLGADIAQLNMPSLAASGRFSMPVVAMAHSCVASWWDAVFGGAPPDDFIWRSRLMHAGLHRSAAIVAPSRAFARTIRRIYRLVRPPVVVHNGRACQPLPRASLHDFVFTAGRLWDQGKNLALLDRAAARLCIPVKAAGAICGPHGERIKLKNIKTLGEVGGKAVAGCLASRPIFVSVARYEPFGLAALEAAQAGCALILSDIPTFRELWGGAALFVDAEDPEALADAIESVAVDMPLRLKLGEAAGRQARRYTVEAMAAAMAAIYGRVASRPLAFRDPAQVAA